MRKLLTDEEFKRMTAEYDKVKYKCKYCGRRVVIGSTRTKSLCDWCGHWVFKDEKEEFKYRMKERIINERRTNKN